MASTLKHLRSSTADKRPTASGLADGQLAINTASGTPGLFFKDSANQVVKVGPVHVGPTPPNDAPVGSSGNSRGELWVDNSLTTPGLNYYTGTAFVNLTPSGTTSTVGLVELATNAETQTGSDSVRAVTPAGLQSKVSDSVSTTSSISIASSTAVKTAYDLAAAALPASGGRVTGTLEIGPSGFIAFEGSSDDSFETFLTAVNPTADRTITFPNITGTLITDADTGTVTNTMLAGSIATTKLANGALPSGVTVNSSNIVDGSIVNADISASAAIAYSKLSLGTSIVDGDISATAAIAGTKISPNFGSQNIVTTGNVNIDSGTFYVDAVNNRVGVGTTTPATLLDLSSTTTSAKLNLTYPGFGIATLASDSTGALLLQADEANTQANSLIQFKVDGGEKLRLDASGNLGLNGAAADYSGYKNIRINGTDGGILDLSTNGTSVFRITGGTSGVFYYTQNTAYPHVWGAGASERMRLDASGNLGLGVVPSAFGGGRWMQFLSTSVVGQQQNGTADLMCNAYESSGNVFSYIASAGAARYNVTAGSHAWHTAPVGTAGAAITFTQAMTLTADGNLGIGGTPVFYYPGSNNIELGNVLRFRGNAEIAYANSALNINNFASTPTIFYTSNTERMRITSAGNVGIGTTGPGAKLDVVGDIRAGKQDYSFQAIQKVATFNADGVSGVYPPSSFRFYATPGVINGNSLKLGIRAQDDTNGETSDIVTILSTSSSGGRVGIGTTAPSSVLHCVGSKDSTNFTIGAPLSTVGGGAFANYSQITFENTSGSNSNAAIRAYGNLWNAAGSELGFFTSNNSAPAERLRISAAGNVGIGTTSPGTLLTVNSSYAGYGGASITGDTCLLSVTGSAEKTIRIDGGPYQNGTCTANLHLSNSGANNFNATDTGFRLQANYNGTTGVGYFSIDSSAYSGSAYAYTPRLRIDNAGRLLVGTTSAKTAARPFLGTASPVTPLGQFEGYQIYTDEASRCFMLRGNSTSDIYPYFALVRSKGNALGSNTAVANGDNIGAISFQGMDGTNPVEAASIVASVDGAPGTNDMPGRLVFSTTADGAASPTERMRIANNGTTHFLSTTDAVISRTSVAPGTTNALYFGLNSSTSVSNGNICFVTWSNGNVQNTNNSYGAYSDIKLKENIVDATSQWSDIKSLQIRKYNFKEGQTHTQIGLIAQEVELVSPGLVTESPDRDAEGNDLGTVTKSVNYSVLYMKAVKALQEAMERIETLEAKVAALESR